MYLMKHLGEATREVLMRSAVCTGRRCSQPPKHSPLPVHDAEEKCHEHDADGCWLSLEEQWEDERPGH